MLVLRAKGRLDPGPDIENLSAAPEQPTSQSGEEVEPREFAAQEKLVGGAGS